MNKFKVPKRTRPSKQTKQTKEEEEKDVVRERGKDWNTRFDPDVKTDPELIERLDKIFKK